jgi:hypothetical protein
LVPALQATQAVAAPRGGEGADEGLGIALDPGGTGFVTGRTSSSTSTLALDGTGGYGVAETTSPPVQHSG